MNSAATKKVTYFHGFRGSQTCPGVVGIGMCVSEFLTRARSVHLHVGIYLVNVSKQV